MCTDSICFQVTLEANSRTFDNFFRFSTTVELKKMGVDIADRKFVLSTFYIDLKLYNSEYKSTISMMGNDDTFQTMQFRTV